MGRAETRRGDRFAVRATAAAGGGDSPQRLGCARGFGYLSPAVEFGASAGRVGETLLRQPGAGSSPAQRRSGHVFPAAESGSCLDVPDRGGAQIPESGAGGLAARGDVGKQRQPPAASPISGGPGRDQGTGIQSDGSGSATLP